MDGSNSSALHSKDFHNFELEAKKFAFFIILEVLKEEGHVKNFQELLSNIFEPLFEVTIDPSKNPVLHEFLREVILLNLIGEKE